MSKLEVTWANIKKNPELNAKQHMDQLKCFSACYVNAKHYES